MSLDFTLKKYEELLKSFQQSGYRLFSFEDYCNGLRDEPFAVLRHDVDMMAENALKTAQIEHSMDIRASYYFRIVGQSNKPEIIKSIAGLGHEIGYHYEDMALCNGDVEKSIAHFKAQLEYFRQFYPVKTICMHGSPRSKCDNRDLWKSYDYHDFGIIGEPYFDVDFSQVFYLTDTGRRWDGFHVSLRDRIPAYQDEWIKKGLVYPSTDDIIRALKKGSCPKQVMLTSHPQRWTDNHLAWMKERILQSAKNVAKGMMARHQ